MTPQQLRAKRAREYDQKERACDNGIGHPSGPTGWRESRKGVTGAAAMLRRLRKLRPDLHQLVLEGELTTCAAAIQAGFRRGPRPKPVVVSQIPPMGGISPLSQIPSMDGISPLQEMELWLGPSHHGSAFANDDERRRLWFEHRDRLMRWFAHEGRRPQAWWKFEAPIPWPGYTRERSSLWAAGLLGAAEARALEKDWREEFDRSLMIGFTFNDGPRGILTGEAAHIAHLVFHDVPAALAGQWRDCDDAEQWE